MKAKPRRAHSRVRVKRHRCLRCEAKWAVKGKALCHPCEVHVQVLEEQGRGE